MKVLFVVAEMQEAIPLIEHFKLKKKNLDNVNLWANDKYKLLITGPGVLNIIKSLSTAMQLGILNLCVDIINIGYAGSKGLRIGSVVPVKACRCFEFPVLANIGIKNYVKLIDDGVDCYTSIDFVQNANNIPDVALFDMELAYIAKFVYNSLHSIKIVSDNLDYVGFKNFDKAEVWPKAIRMIEEIIEKGEKKSVSRNITT